ncbi:MAG: fatty acid hydroxylase family protein [Gammaproteobacteria bacterium]|nr:MAG: fatty acid hydroxylase family protein [Gammaproteobacteria bacterium]
MDLITFAAPFFVAATIIELIVDRLRGSKFYRANDAINSLSTGMLYMSLGYFTKFAALVIWGYVLQNFALIDMSTSWFDASPRGIALWVVAALGWDFCYYWFHRASHEVSILWASHAVHHQSEDYNLSTAQRQTSSGFLFGWIFYLPLFVIGFPLEVLLTVGAVNLIYQFWVHTQMIDRLGVMDRIMITPSNHRVHHAQNAPYIDKNYGGMLILWDRLFGTYAAERDDEAVVFGVRKPLANWNPFWANLQVYDYLLYDSIRTKRWRDKIGVWFRRTGWRPADMEAAHPKQQSNLVEFKKFDPDIGQEMQRYVLFQFLAAISLGLLIANVYIGGGLRAIAALCIMLWAHLYTIGLLNQGRPNALVFESLRLVVVNGAALFAMRYSEFAVAPAAWVWIGIYTFVSMLWIIKLKSLVKTITSTA